MLTAVMLCMLTGCAVNSKVADEPTEAEVSEDVEDRKEEVDKEDLPQDDSSDVETGMSDGQGTVVYTEQVLVTADEVNVRDYPSTGEGSSVIGKAYQEDCFSLIGQNDEWYQIEYMGQSLRGVMMSRIPGAVLSLTQDISRREIVRKNRWLPVLMR